MIRTVFRPYRSLVLSLSVLLCSPELAFSKVWTIPASENLERDAQEALLQAAPGDTVLLPEGRFQMSGDLSMVTSHLTLKGQGLHKTILVYGQDATGAQGIYAGADHATIEDLSVVDHPGDAIKMVGINGATVRRVKIEWTKIGSQDNGGYGVYPVLCSNILLEDNIVIGSSDAGLYVGQSVNIIVRRNRVEHNVAGIEIENSVRADVYDNVATKNTGGILVFNLPNLLIPNGKASRVFRNHIYDNNFKNIAPKSNSVALVPQGTGIIVLANDEVEIFENTIEKHNTLSIAIANFHVTERTLQDPNFDALPEAIYIHDNIMRNAGRWPIIGGNKLGLVLGTHSFPHRVPHISYDGIGLPDANGNIAGAQQKGDQRICISDNDHDGGDKSYYGNFQLWKTKWWSPLPGGLDRDLTPHSCELPRMSAVEMPPVPPPPQQEQVTDDEINELCGAKVEGVNWEAASKVDCPELADYSLFAAANDPLSDPRDGGLPYDLTTPLFSDYANKDRVLFLPPGTAAAYRKHFTFELPLGTIVSKTFYYPQDFRDPSGERQIIETRLLIHRKNGWQGLVYLWDKEKGAAKLTRSGANVPVSWIDQKGRKQSTQYQVPNLAQCGVCHVESVPNGLKAGALNRDGIKEFAGQNQLSAWAQQSRLADLPSDENEIPRFATWNQAETGSLGERARAYLDMNCGHCHSPSGKANTSALFLNIGQAETIHFGICKSPIAAGRGAGGKFFDIIPGKPDDSLVVARMKSTKAAVKMPELAKTMVHEEGVALISEWIKKMEGECKE